MRDLDATTRTRLVDLRRLVREAQARTQDRTHAGQLMSILLLDAACEHAISLARAHTRLGRVDSFEKALKELESANATWAPPGRKGVIELRQQRNGAMHHGIAPDADDVGRWAGDVNGFVDSVVLEFFGTDLNDVAVADSVQDPEVRRLLHASEHALEVEDFAEAKYAAVDAFDAARERWKDQRPRPGVPWYDRREANMPEGVLADLGRLRDQAEVQPFATDFGEYLWLKDQHRRYTRQAPVPIEDALRALAFATEWILRWEAHRARQVDRDAEWRAKQQPPTSGNPDAVPSVLSIAVTPDIGAEGIDPAMVRITAQLQDLPGDEREDWCRLVGDSLSGRISGFGSRGVLCDPAGRLSFEIPLGIDNTELLVDRIVAATTEATERWREHCAQKHAAELEATRKLTACREALQPWLEPNGPVRHVDFAPGRQDAVRVHLAERLSVGDVHWAGRLLREAYGDQPGSHWIEVEDQVVDLPFPSDGDAGLLLAAMLRELDESNSQRARTRAELERFATALHASMNVQLMSQR